MKQVHTATFNGKWMNKYNGKVTGGPYSSKNEAIKEGNRLAKKNKAQHVIHSRDGKFCQR